MTDMTFEEAVRELDRRISDGIDVRLLRSALSDQVVVAVRNARTSESLELRVAAGDAGFAFHHPDAYANCPRAAGSFVI